MRSVPAWGWLTGIVVLSTAVLTATSFTFSMPIVFIDEIVYSNAAKAFAAGRVPGAEGGTYGYGLTYPLLVAPAYALLAHTTEAYTAVKVMNAALFSFAAVPAYFLTRRVARSPLALGVAVLTVLLPARTYALLLLTESLAFLIFLVSVLAIVRVLEKPTAARQLVMIGSCLLAVDVRRQLIVLVAAIPVMLVAASAMEGRSEGNLVRRVFSRYAVTWGAGVFAAIALAAITLVRDQSPASALGPYSVLASSYEPGAVGRWALYHLASYGLTVAVIPLIALPFGLSLCLRREAPAPHRALAIAATSLIVFFVLEVALFSSTTYGLGRMHERYLFYLTPLVLAMMARWIDAGLPGVRSFAAAVTAVVVVASPLLLPSGGLATGAVDAPTLYTLGLGVVSGGAFNTFRVVAILAGGFLALWLFLVRPRYGPLLLVVVAAAFLTVDISVRADFARDARKWEMLSTGDRDGLPRDWIDRSVGRHAAVSVLFLTPPAGCASRQADYEHALTAYWRTAFFNSGLRDIIELTPESRPQPSHQASNGPVRRADRRYRRRACTFAAVRRRGCPTEAGRRAGLDGPRDGTCPVEALPPLPDARTLGRRPASDRRCGLYRFYAVVTVFDAGRGRPVKPAPARVATAQAQQGG